MPEQLAGQFKIVRVRKIHPSFGAQVEGVGFCRPISTELFAEILTAIAKVRSH